MAMYDNDYEELVVSVCVLDNSIISVVFLSVIGFLSYTFFCEYISNVLVTLLG